METVWSSAALSWLTDAAQQTGFAQAGVAPVTGLVDEQERRDAARFTAWVDAGRAGEMEYLKRRSAEGELVRASVQTPLAWARSVIVCAINYRMEGPLSIECAAPGTGWIARYAWSGRREGDALAAVDYHHLLLERLRSLERRVREHFACETRCYVDTGPLVERSLAARAGVGWIGKNTCVLNQELGSWLLLGTIVTSVPVAADVRLEMSADRCGSCTRCVDACPTEALAGDRTMDASRCIAYLTIEKKGAIAEELRAGMGRQIFGCDICQEVCPWNRRSPVIDDAAMQPRAELINPELDDLATMASRDFRRWFRGSPLERTGLKRLRRNVAIAMGNSGEERFREQLKTWTAAEDPVLAETAAWALERLLDGAAAAGCGAEQAAPLC